MLEKHDLRFGQVFEKTEQGLFVAGFQRANVNFHAVIGGEGFIDFFEEEANLPFKRNIIATNSIIHNKLRDIIDKKDIE